MIAVKELHMLSRDDTVTWKSRKLNRLVPGNDPRDNIRGLTMTLNEMTNMVQCDAPGWSIGVHASRATLVYEANIPAQEPVVIAPSPYVAPVVEAEPTYADEEEEIDDDEVAALVQGPVAQAAIKARKKPGPKPKARKEVTHEEEANES